VGSSSAPQPVVVTNTGSAALTITSILINGANPADFSQTNNCPASLAPNAPCTVQVTFTPTVTGLRNAVLSFTDNALGSPQTVPLTGNGIAQGPKCAPPANMPLVQNGTSPLSVVAAATCSDANAPIVASSIDWGDGSTPTAGTTGTHTYATPNVYTVTVSATDKLGLTGNTSQTVTMAATLSAVFAGQQTSTQLSVTAPAKVQVTFRCNSGDGPSGSTQNLQQTYGINCVVSPMTATLSQTPVSVTVTINTTGSTAMLFRRQGDNWLLALVSWAPLAGLIFLNPGILAQGHKRKYATYVLVCLICALLLCLVSCGGGFNVPSQNVTPSPIPQTPAGQYFVTVTGVDSNEFVQTSLIVPLQVASH
jgi:hypothetical protein